MCIAEGEQNPINYIDLNTVAGKSEMRTERNDVAVVDLRFSIAIPVIKGKSEHLQTFELKTPTRIYELKANTIG